MPIRVSWIHAKLSLEVIATQLLTTSITTTTTNYCLVNFLFADMAEPQLELQCLGRCILGTFRALSDATWDVTEDNGFPSKDQVSIEHQRFILWARSLGLNQVGHASLDYRVRDASVVKVSLADLLTELGDHLENREWRV